MPGYLVLPVANISRPPSLCSMRVFQYVKEVVSPQHAVLEFTCEVDGIMVNGVDIMTFDDAGKIVEFKAMVRPLVTPRGYPS